MNKKLALEILIKKYEHISNLHGKENEFSQALLIAIDEIKNYIKNNDQNP